MIVLFPLLSKNLIVLISIDERTDSRCNTDNLQLYVLEVLLHIAVHIDDTQISLEIYVLKTVTNATVKSFFADLSDMLALIRSDSF